MTPALIFNDNKRIYDVKFLIICSKCKNRTQSMYHLIKFNQEKSLIYVRLLLNSFLTQKIALCYIFYAFFQLGFAQTSLFLVGGLCVDGKFHK